MWRTLPLLAFLALVACSHRRTVSCQTEHQHLMLCHEWRDASEELVAEVKGPICHSGDETFVDAPCPTANVIGVCTHGSERTLFYANPDFPYDGHKGCESLGDVWSATP